MKKILLFLSLLVAMSLFAGCGISNDKGKKIENITREETASVQKEDAKSDEEVKTEEPQKDEYKKEDASAASSKSLNEIRTEIINALSVQNALELDASAMTNLYGINSAHIVEAAGFVVMEGTFPHEAVMIKAKDNAAAAEVERLLKVKHQSFLEQAKGYDAQNYALAQKCKVERNGSYVSMFLTPDFEAMKNVYGEYIK